MKSILTVIVLLTCLLNAGLVSAQYPMLVDKVTAQVGDKIVLKSDIEFQYLQVQEQSTPTETMRCDILDQMIAQQMLVLQAEEDSVIISDEEVEVELSRRFEYFISLLGSQEKLEEFYGKSIVQLKEDFREDIRTQLLAQRMQGVIAGDVRISPAEVRNFFKDIPTDSLPYFDAEVELAHIVLIPGPTVEQRQYAKSRAEELRQRVLNGESIQFLSPIYSDDPGSKETGGDLGCMGRGKFVPEFEAAAFRLKNGEFSEVVETEFGFHVIEMVERKGEQACLRHLLVSPKVTSSNLARASSRLDSLKKEIEIKNITFAKAVKKFSQDEGSRLAGGDIFNQQEGSTVFPVDQLDRETYYAIENLAPGELSSPQPFVTSTGKQAYRIILLKDESEPHAANLEQDYSKIQAAALQKKRSRLMDEWLEKRLDKTYLRIDPVFSTCPQAKKWETAATGGIEN